MLPSNLLRARISRGKIRPVYVNIDPEAVALATRIIGDFKAGVGKRKGELLERLKGIEDEGHDFKLVRGMSALLERRCRFEVESETNPMAARMAVFEAASRAKATSYDETKAVIRSVSTRLGISPEALERALFSDLEDELMMRGFVPLSAELLIKRYNLSLMQTLLFKSLRVEFTASGNWKNIFREVKRQGLMYSVEEQHPDYRVSLDGPLSLFRFTERYGTSIAKVLPRIVASGKWSVKAEILARNRGGRVYTFEANGGEVNDLIVTDRDEEKAEASGRQASGFDSTVEERFAKAFLTSYGSMGWVLRREPEPLVAGTHVLIPDFSLEKHTVKVYVEIVGFWTSEYLERKLRKLKSVEGVDMIIAADESLACSKLERLRVKADVIYYKKDVPLKQIVEHLKERESAILRAQASGIEKDSITLKGDVVTLEDIAKEKGVSLEAVGLALQDFRPSGYDRVGNLFISEGKLRELDERLGKIKKLTEALAMIESSGVREREASKVLDSLGYTSVWEGMAVDEVRISKPATTKAVAASK